MKKFSRNIWVLAALALLISACSSGGGTPTPTPWVSSAKLPGEIIYLDGWEDGMYVCLILPDRSNLRCEMLGEQLAIDFTWSADGSRVAYLVQTLTGELTEVWVVDPSDLKSAQRILGVTQDYPTAPALSADGRWLVVEAAPLEGGTSDLYAIDLTATSTVIPIVAANSPANESRPEFSPVENRLVFISDRLEEGGSTVKIYAADLDGANLNMLTSAESDSFAPAWSPDGEWIAYYQRDAHSQNSSMNGLWVMAANGSQARLVAPIAYLSLDNDPPAWSPDGKWIAYMQNEEESGEDWFNPQLWIVSSSQEGAKPVQISLPGTANFLVSWSPDSRALMYTQRSDADYFLYVVRRDGTDHQKFIECTLCAFSAWSPK